MTKIQKDLKELLEYQVIPEVEEYSEELHELLKSGKFTQDDMDAIKEMESFLVELESTVDAINKNLLSDEDAKDIYENMVSMMEEHGHDEEE